jgi:hypothetical protein
MTDKLVISIGEWVTIQADGWFAVAAATVVAVYFGSLWFALWWVSSRYGTPDS